ncbi:MAG: FAD-dependent oxidoreductase, partial [Spirochaetota bacterium]
RKYFPGMAHAEIKAVAADLGVRETRRINGEYRLTVDDLVTGKDFPDTIGFSAYGWDLHPRPGETAVNGYTTPKPELTAIPYRIMIPKGASNVICPGRAVSVERHVLGPLRVMAPVMAMGEAAGIAAAQINDAAFRDVSIASVRDTLKHHGAIINRSDV